MKPLPEKIIDFHVHLFPDKLFVAIWTFFKKDYGMDVIHRLYSSQCIEYLRNHRVGPIVYSNYAHKKGVAPLLNAWNRKLLDETDDVYCFAAFHPDDEDALESARNIISHPKVLGFKLQLLVQRFYPDDDRLSGLYELIMEKNKRLLFHVGTGPVGNKYVGIDNFHRVPIYVLQVLTSVLPVHPLVFKEFFDLLENHENLYFDTAFCFLPKAAQMYNLGGDLLEQYKDRLLYGSDFPNIIFPREEEIDSLLRMDLSNEFYERVFRTNGRRLIELHAR